MPTDSSISDNKLNLSAASFMRSIAAKRPTSKGGLTPYYPTNSENSTPLVEEIDDQFSRYNLEWIEDEFIDGDESSVRLPRVVLPGNDQTVTDAARRFGELLAPRRTHFVRGGQVVRIAPDESGVPTIELVVPIELVPELPMRQQLWRCSIHPQRASSKILGLERPGTALKSNASKSFGTGKPACLMRACKALALRVASSNSVSRSRYSR